MDELVKKLESWSFMSEGQKVIDFDFAKILLEQAYFSSLELGYEEALKRFHKYLAYGK